MIAGLLLKVWSRVGPALLQVLAIVGVVGAILLGARQAGRDSERRKNLEANARVKEKQLQSATQGPRTRDDLRDLLNGGRF